jgi:hypothetical protein
VSVTSDDVTDIKAALAWAKATCDGLALKQPVEQPVEDEVKGEEEVPVCAVHNLPTTRQRGKCGPFWSCHQRNDDGCFCSYRPDSK